MCVRCGSWWQRSFGVGLFMSRDLSFLGLQCAQPVVLKKNAGGVHFIHNFDFW